MASLAIEIVREKYPGMTDTEAAEAFARENGYIAILRYKNMMHATDFTNFGLCKQDAEIQGYLSSPNCHDAEVVFDGRPKTFKITDDLILKGKCFYCGRKATTASLQLMGGNDFTICPKCGNMFCDGCYMRLPLLRSPGYGACPNCQVEVIRAIPGMYGKV